MYGPLVVESQRSPCSSPLRSAAVIVPTCDARPYWSRFREGLDRQGLAAGQVLIVDSSSTDGTDILAREAGYRVVSIPRTSFGHGATRQMAANLVRDAEFLVYLTQDAILSNEDSMRNLLAEFESPLVGAAYGRQLPRPGAGTIERHARSFNYPVNSCIREFEDRKRLGFRVTFFSNSFAAYRRTAFDQVGGFPEDAIMLEDMTVAARMLMANWKVAYCADAEVFHSHGFSLRQEFSRYFDIAVHHGREPWLLETFGTAGGEGRSFVVSELRFLFFHAPHLIPVATLRNGSKWVAYHLGLKEKHLPLWTNRWLSGTSMFWNQKMDLDKRTAPQRVVKSTSQPAPVEIPSFGPTLGN